MPGEFDVWIPHRLRAETADCRWLHVGDTRFTDPFFEETTSRCLSLPENSYGPPRITPLSRLPEIAAACDAVEPSAFVFHVSRCGSTLVSQLLGLDDACIMLSEVPFFDELLRARFKPELAEKVDVATLLPAAIRLHARKRTGGERSLVVKLDSWHAGFHAELRALYPRTPFILLYRHPAAVVRSHRKLPGMGSVSGLIEDAVFGFDAAESAARPWDTHLPRVLAFYYATFLAIARTDPRALLVPYAPDMIPAVEAMASFSGIGISAEHRVKMRARVAFHAKHPQEKFSEGPIEDAAGDALRTCVERYEELERFREASVSASRFRRAAEIEGGNAGDDFDHCREIGRRVHTLRPAVGMGLTIFQ